MLMALLSVGVTVVLGWCLTRVERDSLLRLPLVAVLMMSTLWTLWSLVSMAPMGSAASLHAKAAAEAASPGFWSRLGHPGLTGTRISAFLFVVSLVLALWPLAGVLGRVLRTALVSAMLFLCFVWSMGLAFAVFWSGGSAVREWNAEITLTILSFVLLCIALVRQGIPAGLPNVPWE